MGLFSDILNNGPEEEIEDEEYEYEDEPEEYEEELAPAPEAVAESPVEIAVISSTTKIDGNVTTDGHLILNGEIKGNVNVSGNIVIDGLIDGDIVCHSAILKSCRIDSGITAKDNVVVNEGTAINGTVNCASITILGEVCGDIYATDSVFLKKTAVVKGDIKAKFIGIETGAKISGQVDCD